MRDDVSMFQQLIFSILMRHKNELYSNLDKIILEQVTEVKIDEIIRKMFYELKIPNLDEKILAFINNEFVNVIGRHVDDYDVERKVQKYIDKIVDEKVNKVLKEKYTPEIPQNDVLLTDFYIKGNNYSDFDFLPFRAINCLKMEGVKTVGQLLSWCEHQLLKIPNLGRKSLAHIKTTLSLANLSLGERNSQKFGDYNSKCQSCTNKENFCN